MADEERILQATRQKFGNDHSYVLEDPDDSQDRRAIDEEDDEDFKDEIYHFSKKDTNLDEIFHYEQSLHDLNSELNSIDKKSAYLVPTSKIEMEGEPEDNYWEEISKYTSDDFEPILDKEINGRLDVDDVISRHRRVRRSTAKKDTIEHVTKIMESIEEELDDLKVIIILY